MSNVSGYYVYQNTNQTPIANLPGANNTSYTATSLQSSTQYQFTVTSYDGANVQSPRTSNVTVTTSGTGSQTHLFPKFGRAVINGTRGSNQGCTNTDDREIGAKTAKVILLGGNGNPFFPNGNSETREQVYQDFKTRAITHGINLKIVQYDDFNEVNTAGPLLQSWLNACNTNNWWLYEHGTSGTVVKSTWNNAWYLVNMTHYCPPDSQGLYPYERAAQIEYNFFVNGYDGTSYYPANKTTQIDGYCVDNIFNYPITSTGVYDLSRTNTAIPESLYNWRLGQSDYAVKLRSLDNNLKVGGNLGGLFNAVYKHLYESDPVAFPNNQYPFSLGIAPWSDYTGWENKFNFGACEVFLGGNGNTQYGYHGVSAEVQLWGTDRWLKVYKKAAELVLPDSWFLFQHDLSDLVLGRDIDSSSDFQAVRYGLAMCSMGDFGYWTYEGTVFNNPHALDPNDSAAGYLDARYDQVYDEMYGGSLNNPDWLGTAVDAQQDSPWPVNPALSWTANQTVYARRFSGGAVFINARGASAVTINLTNPFGDGVAYQRLSASTNSVGNRTINNGQVGGNYSLPPADAIFVIKTTSSFNPPFPRLGSYWLGNTEYETPTNTSKLAKLNVAVIGVWPGWESTHGSYESLLTNVKAINPNTKIFNYVQNTVVQEGNAAYAETWNKVVSMSWFLYLNGTSGTRVTDEYGNLCNYTTFTNPDSNGDNWINWYAKWAVNKFITPAPSFDGLYTDNVWWAPRDNGDWNLDGITDSKDNPIVQGWQRQGLIAHISKLKELMPGKLQLGNIADWGDYGSVVTGYENMLHGGVIEWIVGTPFSPETWGGFTYMMDWYKKSMGLLLAPKIGMFHQAGYKTDFQSLRYGLAACLMDNGYFTFDDIDGSALPWFDEYDSNLGYPTSSTVPTTAWKSGIWRRDYDNGIVLVNPKGNGDKNNISLDGTFYKIQGISGQSDLAVNNGSQVTTISLKDRDGIILKRAP